jgi:predicted dienelactone hydrolase
MKRLLKIVLAISALGAAAVITLVLLLWRDHYTEVTLPPPTGSFAVGRATDVWRDSTRELPVWIWYPAAPAAGAKPAEYVPRYWLDALGSRPRSRLGAVMGTLLSRDAGRVHPHSVVDVPVATERPSYPIVILRGGLGAWTTEYTTLAEDLASHGYIVVGFDAPGRTGVVVFPDGRIVDRPPENNPETVATDAAALEMANRLLSDWVRDVGFVVDRLEALNVSAGERFSGRLNLRALGVAGHSLGGATALQFCHDDARCRAGIDIDGRPLGSVVKDGLRQPFMMLLSDHSRENDPVSRQIRADIQSIYDRLPADSRSMITVPGANHFSFSDQMVTRPQTAMAIAQLVGALRLEPRQGLAIAADHVRRFFDARLKGTRSSD